jgi:hypothetical protein
VFANADDPAVQELQMLYDAVAPIILSDKQDGRLTSEGTGRSTGSRPQSRGEAGWIIAVPSHKP